jgi:hypothetical protein
MDIAIGLLCVNLHPYATQATSVPERVSQLKKVDVECLTELLYYDMYIYISTSRYSTRFCKMRKIVKKQT